jgi:hypothetical protein
MAMPKLKQIDGKGGQVHWDISGLTLPASGSTKAVTSIFTGQVAGGSDTALGVYVTAPQNKVQIRKHGTGKAVIDDTTGGMIFSRLTESSGTWTLTFYVLDNGSETALDFTNHPDAGAAIDFRWCETVRIGDLKPTAVVDAGEGIDEFNASSPQLHQHTSERLTVTSNGQTAFTLSHAPKDGADARLTVNGIGYENGASADFSVSGTALTWRDVDFTLDTSDEVIAHYEY